ncbi:MAG: DNA polymerase III subunit delta [Deltaproteobacteria bacterium]|nr:DNA polymerase III subunit delta [Deltaproteobacteria bacterium]
MFQEVEELKKEFSAGRVFPAYLVIGGEDLMVSEIAGALKQELFVNRKDQNVLILDSLEIGDNRKRFENALQEIPLFGGRSLVVVRNFLLEKIPEALVKFVSAPSPFVVLLLAVEKKPKDGGKTFMKNFQKTGKIIEIREMKRKWDIYNYMQDAASRMNLELTQDAIDLLYDMIGEGRQGYHQALDKLKAFAGDEMRTITGEDVARLAARTREHTPFELCDAAAEKNAELALKLTGRLIDGTEDALRILALLSRHFRNLYSYYSLKKSGRTDEEVKKEMGIFYDFIIQKYANQLKRLNPEKITKAFELFIEADMEIKMNPTGPRVVVENMIMRLMSVL